MCILIAVSHLDRPPASRSTARFCPLARASYVSYVQCTRARARMRARVRVSRVRKACMYLAGNLRTWGTWLVRALVFPPIRSKFGSDGSRGGGARLSFIRGTTQGSPAASRRSDGIIQHPAGSCCDLDNRALRDRPDSLSVEKCANEPRSRSWSPLRSVRLFLALE